MTRFKVLRKPEEHSPVELALTDNENGTVTLVLPETGYMLLTINTKGQLVLHSEVVSDALDLDAHGRIRIVLGGGPPITLPSGSYAEDA